MDMANYNYYKSQNSDFIKKIRCNNNNININGENTGYINLGNNDQGAAAEERYLSVSSFGSGNVGEGYDNKVFDCVTNNDNIVQGGTDAQGPVGPNQIGSTNLYLVEGKMATAETSTGGLATSIATCETGDVVIEGGYDISVTSSISPPIRFEGFEGPLPNPAILPSYTGPNNSAYGVEIISDFTRFQAYAYCFDNSP